ncbi:phage tail protein [Exiguobacterium sp. R-39]|uniref:phage tail protein n=1 Tax=Exiguobacterium sp. R-39 TaxID=3416708 RepID=UPI003CE83C0D
MALRENQIIVDILANADPLREINQRINEVTHNTHEMTNDINRMSGNYTRGYRRMGDSTNWMMMQTRGMSQEALQMKYEMTSALQAQQAAMVPFRNQLMKAQYDMFRLTQAADTYSGSTNQFMRDVQKAGLAHKKVTDAMMAADHMAKMGFIQGVGQMLARSTQANKIAANFDRMNNPLYQVNKGALAVADGLNRIALQGQPAALALQMLGPTANMKQLNEMTMMISQGLMRMQMVAMAAAITSALLYSTLHQAAMKSVAGYEEAFNRMQSAVRKAFEPMVQVFGDVMKRIYNFITVIANMVTAFNEAHPATARMLQGLLMLIPALTLILSPLAIGIGLIMGMKAAFAAAWMLIGPLVTGLAAMSGTVYLVAAAIVGMVAGFRKAYRENEAFAAMIDNLTDKLGGGFMNVMKMVGSAVVTIFSGLTNAFAAVFNILFAVITKVNEFAGAFQQAHPILYRVVQGLIALAVAAKIVLAFLSSQAGMALAASLMATLGPIPLIITGLALLGIALTVLYQNNKVFADAVNSAWKSIQQVAQQVFGFLATFLAPIFNTIVQQASAFGTAIVAVFNGDFSKIGQLFVQLLPTLIGFLMGGIPGLIIAGSRFIPAIAQGIQSNATSLAGTIGTIVQSIVTFLVTQVPIFINQGVKIITNLVQGITQALPMVVTALSQIILMLVTSIGQLLPVLLQAGMQILQALIAGITTLLPVLLTTALNILTTLITGIVTMIPLLIPVAIQIITTLINTIVTLIPQLLTMGMQLIQQLISGIATAIPLLLTAAMQIILALANAIMVNLPLLLTAAMQILMAIINGIMQMLPMLLTTATQIIMQLVTSLTSLLPQLITVGIGIITQLVTGITQMLPQLITMAVNLITQLTNTLIANLPQIINAGVQILTSLINGIIQMVPQLVAAALQLIVALVQALVSAAPQLLSAGVQLIQALINGILQLLGAVGQAAMSIGNSIMDTLSGIDLAGIGKNIIRGLIGGISSMAGSVARTIGDIANTVKDGITGILGIASPSKVMIEYGGWTSEGLAIGMNDNIRQISDMSKQMATAAIPQMPKMPAVPMPTAIPAMRMQSMLTVADEGLGGGTIGPSGTTNNNRKTVHINFNPTYNITVSGDSDVASIKEQIEQANERTFSHLNDLFAPEVDY